MSAHTTVHMSPAQVAQAVGVSRWTVMRAIKSHDLKASRDNRNQWRISPEALADWQSHNVRTPDDPHTTHTQRADEALVELREKLAAAVARADAAEAERDRWQAMAERLAVQPRRKWWPWG